MITFVFMCILTVALFAVSVICLLIGSFSSDRDTKDAMGMFLFVLFWCVLGCVIGTYNSTQAVDNKEKLPTSEVQK